MRYFDISEFDSPDEPGSGAKHMKKVFLNAIDSARGEAGIPFKINSGYRTPEHNKSVGGSPTSSHLDGFAADIACTDSHTRQKILDALWIVGFNRIGIAHTFIHCDVDPRKKPAVWVYPIKGE